MTSVEIPPKLFGLVLLVLGMVITGVTENYVQNKIPSQYEILENGVIQPLSEITLESCTDEDCIKSVHRVRWSFDVFGIGLTFFGIYAIWKL